MRDFPDELTNKPLTDIFNNPVLAKMLNHWLMSAVKNHLSNKGFGDMLSSSFEDIKQNILLNLWKKGDAFSNSKHACSFFRIAISNAAIDYLPKLAVVSVSKKTLKQDGYAALNNEEVNEADWQTTPELEHEKQPTHFQCSFLDIWQEPHI